MKTKPNTTSTLSKTSNVNLTTEKKPIDVVVKSKNNEQKDTDKTASQKTSPQVKDDPQVKGGPDKKYPLVHIESKESLFDRHPKSELESHEMHPGHLVSVENVGSVPDHYRKLSDGEARNLDMIKMTQEDYMKTKNLNKEKIESKKYKHLKPDQKLTLLQLSMLSTAKATFKRNVKRDSFEEDPIITAYYHEEEVFCLQKMAEHAAEKNEPPKLSVELVFNHPWVRKKSRHSEDLIPVEQAGSADNHHHHNHHHHLLHTKHHSPQDERKKSIFSIDSNFKSSKLTYKSLEAEGYSIFENDDTVFNNILEEERGTKSEFLIRIKKGTNVDRYERENRHPRCNTAYLKCYFYGKPKMFQKPKKESSNSTLVGISGEAYWDHVFILRGFTIDELENVYVLINVKGKCREQGKEQEQGHKGIHLDKVLRAVKGKNLSLGEGILAGKEARIIPSPDFRYREPTEDEYQGWMNALQNPGIPQKFEMALENEDDDSSDESESQSNRKWHSVLHRKSTSDER